MSKKIIEVDNTNVDEDIGSTPSSRWTWVKWPLRALLAAIILTAAAYGSFYFVYQNKIYPGISADGLYLGGMGRAEAADKLEQRVSVYSGGVLPIKYGKTIIRVPLNDLELKYDTAKVIESAYSYGRRGDWRAQLWDQIRSIVGHSSNVASYIYNTDKLTPYLSQINDDVLTPVSNASLSFDGSIKVRAGNDGARLDTGRLVKSIEANLSQADDGQIDAPTYMIVPEISTQALSEAVAKSAVYLSAPITLQIAADQRSVDQATIVSWLKVSQHARGDFVSTMDINNVYPAAADTGITLDGQAIAKFVSDLAAGIDKDPQNAGLSMQDGQLQVTTPSVDGAKLDQPTAVKSILAALAQADGASRVAEVPVGITKADVRADNLDSLGIKEQISEGETYFPGSPSTRLTNVRAGASKFNGVLLKPGATFSFGALLGEVDASTGYVPELVILEDHEEKQYGGGLCQVSSTAFRAALAAGLPILERHNHAFAISYYTWPYSVPGVDATIWYPSADMKFKNDTGSYILIQTNMVGVDLKFDFYGTKTKSGVVRGPSFVSGNNNATLPSHTVFYRDVLDLAGHVTSTDTFDTYYESSKSFPVQQQFN